MYRERTYARIRGYRQKHRLTEEDLEGTSEDAFRARRPGGLLRLDHGVVPIVASSLAEALRLPGEDYGGKGFRDSK